MKIRTCIMVWGVGISLAARAGLYYEEGPFTSSFANDGYIPNGSTVGWSDIRNVTDTPSSSTLTGVSVTLNITGGYNGELYAYLSHNGQRIDLLNHVGKGTGSEPIFSYGYSNPGFNQVRLIDSSPTIQGNIHDYGGNTVPTGDYRPDAGGATFAGTFGGADPSGSWTLFISDLSGGAYQSRLAGWSLGLDVSAVPEPANVALLVFGGLASAGVGWHHWRRRKLRQR